MVEVMLDNQQICYYVYKRPHVDLFLQKVSEWFHVVVFTASVPEYADPVIGILFDFVASLLIFLISLDWLDSTRTVIQKRYFRDSCTAVGSSYMKDLTLVEKDLSKVRLSWKCINDCRFFLWIIPPFVLACTLKMGFLLIRGFQTRTIKVCLIYLCSLMLFDLREM